MASVLFVCLGNICRSPTAEGVFRQVHERESLLQELIIDSAGTGGWHVGKAPDPRAQEAALKRGIDISGQRSRQIQASDFVRFEHVLAMDENNLEELRRLCPSSEHGKLRLFLDFAPGLTTRSVPDPYYGGADGFDTVLDLVRKASEGLYQVLSG
ncbi:MAG: low molecular weight protein-tyrosine-phosphatase [Congregibacter sp.]